MSAGYDFDADPFDDKNPQPDQRYQFQLVRFKDVLLDTTANYLVDGIIPRDALIVVWGPPKCGKSFWAFDLVMHVALSREYRGRDVQQGTVIYVACEGERGLKARLTAFRQARLAKAELDPAFYLLTTRLDLVNQVTELITEITSQLTGSDNPAIIVLDTLNRSIVGSEGSDEDMGAYIRAADQLREAFRCAVILIHHCGYNETRPRGHSSLGAAVDTQIAVKRNTSGAILTEVEWMKDGPEGVMTSSQLKVIDLDIDDSGRMITSCVIEPTDTPSPSERGKPKKLPAAQRRALTLLRQAINIDGEIPPSSNHIPHGTPCVTEEVWRKYCYRGGISTGEQEAKRVAFQRAFEKLVADGDVGSWDGWVWPASQT